MTTTSATPAVKCQEGAIYQGPSAKDMSGAMPPEITGCVRALWKDQKYPFVARPGAFTLQKDPGPAPSYCSKTEFDSYEEARECEQKLSVKMGSQWKIERYQIGTTASFPELYRINDFFIQRDKRPYKIEGNSIKPFDECHSGAGSGDGLTSPSLFYCAYALFLTSGVPHYVSIISAHQTEIIFGQVLPLNVDACIYGGLMFSGAEADACKDFLTHNIGESGFPRYTLYIQIDQGIGYHTVAPRFTSPYFYF